MAASYFRGKAGTTYYLALQRNDKKDMMLMLKEFIIILVVIPAGLIIFGAILKTHIGMAIFIVAGITAFIVALNPSK